ncbi:MAG: phage major tail tube protein [Oscillospiraceae bacterium]|nr:phage major tail tube protein [Oscillospiraceae bacterium]
MPNTNQNIDIAISNYAFYKGGNEFIGVGEITMPQINFVTTEVEGAGIAGTVEETIVGFIETMEMGIAFKLFSGNAISLLEPIDHLVELRVGHQERDPLDQAYKQRGLKHVMILRPKGTNPGRVRKASPADASGTYSCRYWKMELDGATVFEFDPYNFICIINGVDYLAETRRVLGKE